MRALCFYATGLRLLRHVIRPVRPAVLTAVRHRSQRHVLRSVDTGLGRPRSPRTSSSPPRLVLWPERPLPVHPRELPDLLASHARGWARSHFTASRLVRFGVPPEDVRSVVKEFVQVLWTENIFKLLGYNRDMLGRLGYDLADTSNGTNVDITLTRLFYEWASHPKSTPILEQVVPQTTVRTIRELFRCANMSNPASTFVMARTKPPRKVIMHVGPTNSGKTHNALRALAAADRGCYAGPLRLLAHEIFLRLNKGQIIPLGEEPGQAEPDLDTNIEGADAEGRVVVRKEGDARFARPCNLITGEEQIVVDPDAGLASCTVEMVSLILQHDVAVIDEIQMLADPERGGAWTSAVLGLNAVELHLCGEEAAVPLVQEMLRNTGDEVIVNRYQRLTPLTVAKTSLGGQLKNVQKGDCVVAFSRNTIFQTKSNIEQETGLKCAVVYGGLPAELRNEQAKLFNDSKSGYDVIVGSDAIGMGLNLKIKRVVFSQVQKSDGQREILISPPQIKQIAGRAGRYGFHDDDAGGTVTTLHDADLPILQKALAHPPEPLRYARIRADKYTQAQILGVLPASAEFSTMTDVMHYVSKLDPCYLPESPTQFLLSANGVAEAVMNNGLTQDELWSLQDAPVSWRNALAARCMKGFIKMFQKGVTVDPRKALDDVGLLAKLENVLRLSRLEGPVPVQDIKSASLSLYDLEILHKTLGTYMWLSYRLPVGFHDRHAARELKLNTEKSIWFLLDQLSRLQGTDFDLGNMDFRSPATFQHRRKPDSGSSWNAQKGDRRAFENGSGRSQRQRTIAYKSLLESSSQRPSRSYSQY